MMNQRKHRVPLHGMSNIKHAGTDFKFKCNNMHQTDAHYIKQANISKALNKKHLILQQIFINSQAPNIIIAHLRATVLNVATFQNFAIQFLYNQYMNSQSQSSAPKQPKLHKISSLNEQSIKSTSKKASSMGKNCANTDEFDSKQKAFGSIKEMQDSIGKRINRLNGNLYQCLWADSIGQTINLFWNKKLTSNIKVGEQFNLNAEQVNEVLEYLKNQMETSLQNQDDMQKQKQQLEFIKKEDIILQLEKKGCAGEIDLSIQDPQQPGLHKKICTHVLGLKEKGQKAWFIENFYQTGNISQNEKYLFVFQLKRNIEQKKPEKILDYLAQIIKIAIATRELYLEKLIRCKVQRQIYYHELFRQMEQLRKQIAQMRKEKAAQMEKQKEREAQMKAQMQNLKEQLAFLMKDKSR